MVGDNPYNYRLADARCCLTCEFFRIGPPGVGLWCTNKRQPHDDPAQTRADGICDLYGLRVGASA